MRDQCDVNAAGAPFRSRRASASYLQQPDLSRAGWRRRVSTPSLRGPRLEPLSSSRAFRKALKTPDEVRRPRLAAGGALSRLVQQAGDLVRPGEAALETGAEQGVELVQKRLLGAITKGEMLQFVSGDLRRFGRRPPSRGGLGAGGRRWLSAAAIGSLRQSQFAGGAVGAQAFIWAISRVCVSTTLWAMRRISGSRLSRRATLAMATAPSWWAIILAT